MACTLSVSSAESSWLSSKEHILKPDSRYVLNEAAYKPDAAAALSSRFSDGAEFESFYESLSTPFRKNQFLRVACFYRYLVKQGDWHVCVEGHDPVIDYLTNSYKVVGLFSLIESLSDVPHEDFYQWLRKQDSSTTFPIEDASMLKQLYDNYKASFGSIRRCVAFFERLSPSRKKELCNAVHINGAPLGSIKKLAEFLYNIRSKFIHEAELALQVSELRHFSPDKKNIVKTELRMALLLDAFEEGLVAYFCDVI